MLSVTRRKTMIDISFERFGSPPSTLESASAGVLRAVKLAVAGREIEAAQVGIAESHAHRQIRGRRVGFEYRARRRYDVEHGADPGLLPAGARDDIAAAVQAH